jgi:UDP-3-O-[3-hydroxymyristoyl] glucosamine N-acyltransferase
MLTQILNELSPGCKKLYTLNGQLAPAVKRTSFSWSSIPGTLCLAANKKYLRQAIGNDNIKGLITDIRYRADIEPLAAAHDKLFILCDKPADLFYAIHNRALHGERKTLVDGRQIDESTRILPSVVIGKNVTIGRNVVIGENCILHDDTKIGDNCVIHENTIIGTPGYFSKSIFGTKCHVNHYGGVSIGNGCLIHAGSIIAKSVNIDEFTRLEDDVHLGISVNIGHDCNIRRGANIATRALIAGRAEIGINAWVGANAVVSNAVTIGNDVQVKIGSVVIADVAAGHCVSGNFAIRHADNLKSLASQG